MRIKLTSSDGPHRETATAYIEGKRAHQNAENDQTIHGSRWECPRDMPGVAYAGLMNEPDLPGVLEREGYKVDASDWLPPIWDCAIAGCDGWCCPMRDS